MKLVVATDEQKYARDRQLFAAWGSKLTLQGYLEREARLLAQPWARRELRTWLWRDEAGALLASCETYRMDGWYRGQHGDVWAVASVFTEAELRGRGHATAMIDALIERGRSEGVAASILYSDVPPRQYERSGYRLRPAADLLFTPAAGDPAEGVDALVPDRPLGAAADAGAASAELSPGAQAEADDVLIWPTAAQLDWHYERTRTYAALLGQPALPWVGARAGGGELRWCVDWKNASLKLLLLLATRAEEAAALIEAARRVAAALGLGEVRLWAQPWPFAGDPDLGGTRVTRADALPMLAPVAASWPAERWRHIPRALWV